MPSISALSTYSPDWPAQQSSFKKAELKSQTSTVSYKTASKPFQKLISLSNRQLKQSIDITVDAALDSLGVESGHIKGSTVDKIQKGYKEISYDIDLHVWLKGDSHEAWEEKISAIRTQLAEFFSQKVKDRYQNAPRAFKLSDWVRNVPSHSQGDFRQTILSLGYSSAGCTTVDINFTNKNEVCYDTVNSSKHIEFNRNNKTARLKEPWCSSIQTWLTENKWFVFNSAIDGGLRRLSYRLCKTPGALGLQAGLAEYFLDKADVGLVKEVYKRALYGEYPNMQRTEATLEGLWKPVVDELLLNQSDDSSRLFASSTLSSWAACTSNEDFQSQLRDNFPALCEKWSRAAAVGGDLRDMIKSAIDQIEDPTAILRPLIGKAMGYEIVQAETFFTSIAQLKSKKWEELDQFQLSQLSTPYLQFIQHRGQAPWALRAANMQGWGEGKPDESLAFFLDMATELHGSNNTPEWAKTHAIKALLTRVEHEDALQILSQHPRISQLQLDKAQIQHFLTQCLESDQLKNCVAGISGHPRQFDLLLELLDRHHTTIDRLMIGGQTPETASTKALLDHCLRLQADCNTGVLPILRSVLKKTGNKLLINLHGIELSVNPETGLVSKSPLAERGYNAQRQYSIIGNGKKQNATVNLEWFGLGEFTGEQLREEPGLVIGTHSLKWTRSHEQSPPLLKFGQNMAQSIWGNTALTPCKLEAQGTCQLQSLLEYSPYSLSPLLIEHGQTNFTNEQEGSRIIFVFENKQAKSIHLGFRENQAKAKVAALFENMSDSSSSPWKQQPKVEKLAWIKNVFVPNYDSLVKLHNLPTISPCGSIDTEHFIIRQQGDLSWHGRLTKGELLSGARLHDNKHNLALLKFSDNPEESDPIPVDALPLFSEICHLSANGNYAFTGRYLDCSSKTVETGYEGFVHQLKMGPYLFSGYITASDAATGLLMGDSKHFVGSFLLFRDNVHPNLKKDMGYPETEDQYLLPHGRGTMVQTLPNDPSTETSRKQVYCFLQLSFQTKRTNQEDKQFDVPESTTDFSLVTQPKDSSKEEIWFHLSQGHDDFFISRSADYKTERNYSLHYSDVSGFHCKLLLLNRQVCQGKIEFPNGLAYTGQMQLENTTLHLKGQGKVTWKDAEFKGTFDGAYVSLPTAQTPETEVWLNLFLTGKSPSRISLDELFEDFSGQANLFSSYLSKQLTLKHNILEN